LKTKNRNKRSIFRLAKGQRRGSVSLGETSRTTVTEHVIYQQTEISRRDSNIDGIW